MRPEPQAAAMRALMDDLLNIPATARHLTEALTGLAGTAAP